MKCFIPLVAGIIWLAGCSTPSDNPAGISRGDTSTASAEFVLREPAADPAYGYSEDTAVKVGGQEHGPRMERRFLDQLTGPNGERVSYARIGSCCPFQTPNATMGIAMLDMYEVSIAGDPTPKKLYLNMYDFDAPKIPAGFTAKAL